jgi:hypothetical protein
MGTHYAKDCTATKVAERVKPERANLVQAASSLEVSVTESMNNQEGRQGIGNGNRRPETDTRHESTFLLFEYQDDDDESEMKM